jgi:hypothetical protein
MTADIGSDEALSAAVLRYLGRGRFPSPQALADDVLAVHGPVVLADVRALIREIESSPMDWSQGLSAASTEAAERLHARHPALSPEAIAALRWHVSYVWR